MTSITKYATGDSVSLAKLGDAPFTVTAVEDSSYNDEPGVKLTLSQPVTIGDNEFRKVHTGRKTIVEFFQRDDVRADLANSELGPLKCVKKLSDKGREYYVLVDA